MKGIEACVECGYYIHQTDRCTHGANQNPDPQAPFFADCPLKDVQPVIHGKWIPTHEEFSNCSLCKYPVYRAYGETPYCPNCGAKMEKE